MNTGGSGPSRHVVLVGMMGVGKSTVGRSLGAAMSWPFVDSDDEVVARAGRPVAEIFATDGEAAFRVLEATVLGDLLADPRPSVIAAAGGAVLDPATRERLRESATVVWLRAPVDVLVGRTATGTHRPALADDPHGTLSRMESERTSVYESVADVVVDADRPIVDVVAAILSSIEGVVAP